MPIGKGKAAKSSSGASMSQYDVEVEKRLQLLEADAASAQATIINLQSQVEDLKNHVPDEGPAPEPESAAGVSLRVEEVITELKKHYPKQFANL